MAWVVDTCITLDIRTEDPVFGEPSAKCLAAYLSHGLLICAVSYVELAPAFRGDAGLQTAFLRELGIAGPIGHTTEDIAVAHRLWSERVARKRAGLALRRPVADVFIEAIGHRFQGVITRNPQHFPSVPTIVP